LDQNDSAKLQKHLASLAYGSRREMEKWIAAGRVEVNGEPAHLGQRVSPGDRIFIDGKPVSGKPTDRSRVLVYNKPTGIICTRHDPEGRTTVFDDLPRLSRGRWISVGRLDIQSAGLLILTNDGALADRMMRPATGLDREYAVRVSGRLEDAEERRLVAGVRIDDELLKFSDLRYYNGRGTNHWYHVVLMEGRNREIRRLFESAGLTVSRLKRVRFGPVVLPSTLARGRVAELDYEDLTALYKLLKLTLQMQQRPRKKRGKTRSFLLPYPELRARGPSD
jgi:23S rRNA pseudouridine2605 synthase